MAMKSRLTYYPIIRREFESMEELSRVINKSVSYCKLRMNGKEPFTMNDKRLIANYLERADQIAIIFEEGA